MIVISAQTFDLNGSVVIKDIDTATDIESLSRRVNRTATLDGGCEIEDKGLSHSDRTFSIRFRPSKEEAEALKYLIETYGFLNIATPEGVFTGSINNLSMASGEATITVLVEDKTT